MKKITSILAAVAVVAGALVGNAGLQSLTSTRSTGAKKAQGVEVQQIKAGVIDMNEIKAAPRIGETPKQAAAPQRVAIKSVESIVGSYLMTGSSLLSGTFDDSYPVISADPDVENGIIIEGFTAYGYNPLKATVNLSTGEITIPAGQVAFHNTRYDADIYYGTTSGSIDLTTPLVGVVQADGSITFEQWVAIEFEQGFFQAAKNVVMTPANGEMELVTTTKENGEVTEKVAVWISQAEPSTITISHFAGYEDYPVTIKVNKEGTFELPKTVITDYTPDSGETYYDVYTTALDADGNPTEDGTITGEATEDALTWGAWNTILTMEETNYNFYNSLITPGNKVSGKIYYTDGSKFSIPTIDQLAGAGTEEDPFQINDVESLIFFSNHAADYSAAGQFVKVMNDIDMAGAPYTAPCSTNATSFRGTFDGNGKKISNLTIVSDANYVGLVGVAANTSVIKNVILEGLDIDVSGAYVGAVAGVSQGVIDNCQVSTNDGIFGGGYTGGIAGRAAQISNCVSHAYVVSMQGSAGGVCGYLSSKAVSNVADGGVGSYQGTGAAGAGGIVGFAAARTLIENNLSDAYIQSGRWTASSANNGGIVGYAQQATIQDNVTSYAVVGSGATGGIVGYANACTINDNYVESDYTIRGANIGSVGGIVGACAGATAISNSIVDAGLQAYNSSSKTLLPNAGGIIGKVISGQPTITNCLSKALVQGSDSIGGIIGQGGAIINGCVNTGSVNALRGQAGGGLIGGVNAATEISNSYNIGTISAAGQAVANLVGVVVDGVAVSADEAYFVNDFGTPANTIVGTEVSIAELAAMGSDEEQAIAKRSALKAPSADVFDFGDEFTLPLLKSFAGDDAARVEAAAVVLMEGTYDNCTYNLRISGLEGIEWSSSASFIEFDVDKNYAYVTTPSTEAITITATSGDYSKVWNVKLNVETGVIEVTDLGTKQVESVRYFNIAGQESSEAFDGVNVVVTRYTDGTQSSVKVLK